jgi:hypothetical protein
MRINVSGNVGIGTSSPSAPLDLVSDSSTNGLRIRGRSSDNAGSIRFYSNDNATQYALFRADASVVLVSAIQAAPLTFATSGAERVRIDSSGNFMVGTTSDNGSTSNTTRVTGGRFSTVNGTQSTASGTATTVATLPSGEGMYLVTATLNNSGTAAGFNALALVRVSQSNAAASTIVSATNMTISVSGLNVQITHTQGATQNCPFSIIRIL